MAAIILASLAAISVRQGDGHPEPLRTVFARQGEDLEIIAPANIEHPRWFLAVPLALDYDNVAFCGTRPVKNCHQPIQYRFQEIDGVRDRRSFHIADVPRLAEPGTHRICVSGSDTPPEPTEELVESLPQVVIRRGDDYVGRLTELFGVPFVLWPQRLKSGHETDLRIGADCSALVVYGQRRLGYPVTYVAPRGLYRLARELAADESVQRGDILNYGFQSAVLSVDTPPLGKLNPEDRVIQTYHGVAEELPVSALPYRNAPVHFLRWSSGRE